MDTDDSIRKAMEQGEQNCSAFQLVRNWCAHARIEKFGGTGLVEQATGLPIGHHGMKCDHASEAGIAAWDFREAALDFYDRNCIDCKFRKPVTLPNLSQWVNERDERRAVAARQKSEHEAKENAALADRRSLRAQLRGFIGTVPSAVLDHIDEFDEHRDRAHHERICESARLAPEHFVPKLVEYIADLTSGEKWFADTGLTILDAVKYDPARLARLALKSITYPSATRTAARVLLDLTDHVDPTLLPQALPAVIELAFPDDEPFILGHRTSPDPALLIALHRNCPQPVEETLDHLLASRRLYDIRLAARGILPLLRDNPGLATRFARSAIAKFARARLLIDDFSNDRHNLHALSDVIVAAFRHASDNVDAIVQEMIAGSDRHSRDRAFQIYSAVLAVDRHEKHIDANSRPHRISFQRLLWAATTEESDDVLKTVQGIFHGRPYELEDIAREELDSLLGALLIVDDRLRRHDEIPLPENCPFLKKLERGNRRSALTGMMSSLVKWASIAASNDIALVKKIEETFEKIPEGRDDLKGLMLGSIEHVCGTVDGLKLMLPHLYYGLVGPSAVVRSYAATALGELRYATRENIPPLVYEAFSVLLLDPYVVVHKAAVRALDRFSLPENCRGRAAQALFNLVRHYSLKSGEDHFVADCVEQLATELHRMGKAQGNVGRYLIQVLLKTDPIYVQSKLRWLEQSLGRTEGFAELVIRHLPLVEDDFNDRGERELKLLQKLPSEAIFAKRAEFEKVGTVLNPRPWVAAHIVEALARAGAWSEARRVAEAGVLSLEPTVRNRSRRIFSNSMGIAAEFEQALAEGRTNDLADILRRWEKNAQQREEHEADVQERNSRTSFPSSL